MISRVGPERQPAEDLGPGYFARRAARCHARGLQAGFHAVKDEPADALRSPAGMSIPYA